MAVQLLTRHWIITDGRGARHEVQGEGVVGEQPVIAPGASFDYVSGCGINKFRFKKVVKPGDTLRMEVEITKLRGSIGIGEGKAYVGDELAAEGEFMFAIEG